MNPQTIKRINLWSGPRNISTAMMYSFAQRKDSRVVDEPLYAHYLSTTDANDYHPGAKKVLDSMENDGHKVIERMLQRKDKPILFFKQMTHHLVDLDLSFLNDMTNFILTRDPKEMLPSYAEVIERPDMEDIGYKKQHELLSYLQQRGHKPIVVIAKEVLKNPRQKLESLCEAIGIPFDPAMLSWERGPRPEDGVWAPHWYESVHQSTAFKPYRPKNEPVPDPLRPLLEECLPLYRDLAEYAI